MQQIMLKDLINWPKVMNAPRNAGGHHGIMDSLFTDAVILARYIQDDTWQGVLGYVYLVWHENTYAKIAIITDHFGSCSGCDSWEDASDEEARNMCIALANNARLFDSIDDACEFLKSDGKRSAEHYGISQIAEPLLAELEKHRR